MSLFSKSISTTNMHLPFTNQRAKAYRPKEYNRLMFLRVVQIIMFFLGGALFLLTIWFAYTKIFTTIETVQTIISIQSNTQIETIDFSRLTKVEDAWTTKHADTPVTLTRDPFVSMISRPVTSSTTASPTP